MGIQSAMARSIMITANFVFKLHLAALEAPREGVSLYPVMDGLYASADRPETLERFLRNVFSGVALLFAFEEIGYYRFILT